MSTFLRISYHISFCALSEKRREMKESLLFHLRHLRRRNRRREKNSHKYFPSTFRHCAREPLFSDMRNWISTGPFIRFFFCCIPPSERATSYELRVVAYFFIYLLFVSLLFLYELWVRSFECHCRALGSSLFRCFLCQSCSGSTRRSYGTRLGRAIWNQN